MRSSTQRRRKPSSGRDLGQNHDIVRIVNLHYPNGVVWAGVLSANGKWSGGFVDW